jgi:glycosidase
MGKNIYQIYLRSFMDGNHDGIGDIPGVIMKLPYLKSIGIEIIWISPHYDSPMDDHGYDVRDFYRVSSDYGTIDDFKQLITEAHQTGIKVIIDLVLNHTSDEHPWFQAAKDPNHPEHLKYHDYYIWHKPKIDDAGSMQPPTSWIGWFGDCTWTYHPLTDEYYLHIFSKKMPDLNWRNHEMIDEMKRMIRWWVAQGVDGFRLDAANHLEKNWDFPEAYPGYEHFSSLPKHHEYLRMLSEEIFKPHDLLILGESGGANKEEALAYVGYQQGSMNMLIQFGHCWADIDPAQPLLGKWSQGVVDVVKIKKSFQTWYQILGQDGWNLIYWHNHDQPRVISHYGSDRRYNARSGKMLAIALYLMPGSSICYQGEEIGMVNVRFRKLEQFRDVEVFTEYGNMRRMGKTNCQALRLISKRCRDNARTPMQWSADTYAGFSRVKPWIDLSGRKHTINVQSQSHDPSSILSLYRFLLKLRRSDENITFGTVEFIDIDHPDSFCYRTVGATSEYLVITNFRSRTISVLLDDIHMFAPVTGNLKRIPPLKNRMLLAPFAAFVYRRARRRES